MAKASATAPARVSSARDRPDHLAAAASAMALWRGLFFDLPLIWAMEVSHSMGEGLQAHHLLEAGMIAEEDLRIFEFANDAEAAWSILARHDLAFPRPFSSPEQIGTPSAL